ncbi:MAG: cell division protein FtsZ [Bacteroidales bacterium]
MLDKLVDFDIPGVTRDSIITVIGVGGAGNNAVNNLYARGVKGVSFVNCNTDAKVLDISPIPLKIQLGKKLTEGSGAGNNTLVGEQAAQEAESEIRAVLSDGTKMIFLTAGMGGGTGTGASPVIAKIAREMGILTVAVVSFPSRFEGRKRLEQAHEGLLKLQECVDSLLVLKNDKVYTLYGDLPASQAMKKADDIIAMAVKGTAEIVSCYGDVNIDFADVSTVLKDSRVFVMGSGYSEGEARVMKAVKEALESPLLADNSIAGANYILVNLIYGNSEFKSSEVGMVMQLLQDMSAGNAEIIQGTTYDESLGDKIGVTIVASGFADRVRVLNELDENNAEKKTDIDLESTPEPATKSYSASVNSEQNIDVLTLYEETFETEKNVDENSVEDEIEADNEEISLYSQFADEVNIQSQDSRDNQKNLEADDDLFNMEDYFNGEQEKAEQEQQAKHEERLRIIQQEKLIKQALIAEKQRAERVEKEKRRKEEAELQKRREHLKELKRQKDAEEKQIADAKRQEEKRKRAEERKEALRNRDKNGVEAKIMAKLPKLDGFFNDDDE